MLSWLQLRSEGHVLERTHRKLYIEHHKGRKEKRLSQAPVAQAQRVPTPWHSPVAAPLEAAGEATSKTTVGSLSVQSDKRVPAGQQQAACLPAARGVGWPGISASGDISAQWQRGRPRARRAGRRRHRAREARCRLVMPASHARGQGIYHGEHGCWRAERHSRNSPFTEDGDGTLRLPS